MSVNIETAINFLKSQVGKVSYSMYGSRNFSDGTCDCSGAVYTALRKGGASNLGYIASTETLHAWLQANGFKLIADNREWTMKRGDVVIWGRKGESAGAGGHTGICIDGQNWLECTAWKDLGETQQNHDARWSMNGGPYFYVYRYTGATPAKTTPAKPAATQKAVVPTVTYELHQKGAGWLGAVNNFNNSNSNGFAGNPNHQHDAFMAKVSHGSIKYRVHILGGGWLPFVTGYSHTDANNGYAGVIGKTIDGVEVYYITPAGEVPLQAWYRSQTVARSGYLGVVCDDGSSITGYTDSYAGILGEAMDRVQLKIGTANPF